MNNDLLLRKLAFDFSQKSGLEMSDLFQEAQLAYWQAMKTYDPAKGAISTYIWHCVHNRLLIYLRDYQKYSAEFIEVVPINVVTNENAYFENLSEVACKIAKKVLSSPDEFACLAKADAQKKLKEILKNEGWSLKKIFAGFKELQMIYS